MLTKTLSGDAQKSLALLDRGALPTGTYLAGGSALALHFGHRISIDFDFFTDVSFSSEKLAKDLIDLYFLSKKGISLESCFEYYEKKYEALANNLYSILTSLSYFVDAENSEMPVMLEKIDWKKVKIFFEKEAVRLGKKYLEK